MRGYYSVFDPDGKNHRLWYRKRCINLIPPETNIEMDTTLCLILYLVISSMYLMHKQLPTRDIVVNMDGGVGSWKEVETIEIKGQTLELQQSDSQELNL